MKELEEVNCEIHNVIDIQHAFSSQSNNTDGNEGGSSNGSQPYSGIDSHCGGFLSDTRYAWLNYGSHIIIFNARTGESISSWTFRGKIACVCEFPAQPGELPLLLIGLDNGATRIKDSTGLVCVFDCASSRVLRAIKMPVGVEQVCIVSGGAKWEEFNKKRPDNFLMQMDGIACIVLRNLHHLMIDLQRSAWEMPDDLSLIMDESNPADIEFVTSKDSLHRNQLNKSKHMVCNLMNQRIEKHVGFNREEFESTGFLDERLTNTIVSSTKIGCLISGCLGRVIIWQNDGSVGSISLPVDETMIVTHLALLEPADDPRPFYYLWVVFQDESSKVPPLLRMYSLLFQRKYSDRGTNLYFNLEAEPSLKFEFELDADDRVVNLSAIEREVNPDQTESESRRGEDSLLLISSTGRTLLFDLNQWYKEQMPRIVNECKNPNSILASYDTEGRPSNVACNEMVSCTYVPRTLQEFPNNRLSSSEELFYPRSLALEWIELSRSKITCWLSRGVQAELLHEMAMAGPILLTKPSEMFHKCLSVGLVPFNTEVTFSSDHNAQRDMLLSLCLEQHWVTFLIRCAKEWSDGSAAYMYPSFLKWGIQRAASIKMIADHLCVPLFDQSGNNISESELKTLRFCYQQLECLSNVVSKLPLETNGLVKQRKALRRVSIYFQVLLWFYDAGLLPESQDMEAPMSAAVKIPYPYEKLHHLYKVKRESVVNDKQPGEIKEVFFIDELIARECPALSSQWKRESGDVSANGHYPPPSLQSLLRSYLTDCDQGEADKVECKHQITIYLLMDLDLELSRSISYTSYAGVDQLIKYPSSFKISSSITELTQAFWLLDHEDYRGFLSMMTGQLISDSDVKDWHHKLVLRTLIKNDQHKLALMYLRIRKPPLSSVQDQSTLIDLSVEHGLVQSAFHHRPQTHYAQLLMCFFQSCKAYNRLTDVLHLALDTEEEEMFDKFLEESKSEDVRLLYYLQRCRYMEANSGSFAAKNDHVDMLNAYNATLPNIMKKFSMNMSKSASETRTEPRYPRPMTYNKNCERATSIYETVIKKAKETFHREEKAVIPFITAPCTTLKSIDEQIDIDCVMSPKVMQEIHRKRTLDEVQAEDDSGRRTPERVKRRKLVDDGDAAMSAAFSTPLVKRKVSHRGSCVETPHSILKIRQLIRSSTSPSVGSMQAEVTDSSSAAIDKEKKINRQIRFNISQSKKNASNDEISVGDSSGGLHTSERSEEAFFSSLETDKSLMESAVLSEDSITCTKIYAARPRPSIGRSHLQTSSFRDSSRRSLGNANLEASSLLGDFGTTSSKGMSHTSRMGSSWFSASLHSPAVLTPNSSFEIGTPLSRSSVLPSQLASMHNSTKVSIASESLERSCRNSEETMNIDEEEEGEKELEELNSSSSTHIMSPTIPKSNHFKFHDSNVSSRHKNGGVSKDQEEMAMNISYTEDKEDVDNDDEFESFSNTFGNSSTSQLCDEVDNDAQEQRIDDLKNGDHFDITDDESNYAEDMVLALEETTEVIETVSRTTQVCRSSEFDASNITDDESDASVPPDPRKNVEEHLDNNNSMSGAADKTPPKDVDDEASSLNDGVTSRMTRSRRASSITKEIKSSAVGSPSKVVPKTPLRSRRASSLMKEVLIASIAAADEGIRRTGSSGSEESSVTSSPSKSRGRRASMVAKDVSVVEEQSEEDAGVSTPKKTRGKRASSVAKDVSLVEDHGKEDAVMSTPKRTRSRRASSIAKDVSPVGKQVEEVSPSTPRKTRGRRTSLVAKSSLGEEEREEESPGSASSKKTRGRRASSVAKDVHPVGEEGEEELPVVATPKKTRGKRASSVAKDVHPVEEEGEEDSLAVSPSRRTRGRKASSKDVPAAEEQEEVRTPVRRNTRRAASVQKEVPESTRLGRTSSSSSIAVENEEEKSETKSSKTRGAGASNRSKTSEEAAEEKSTVKTLGRKRAGSVPKETVDTVRTRRANSVAKEVIPEEDFEPPQDVSRGRHVVATVSSPAGNTRNRRSSIQSIPEELEEILSVPLKERMSGASSKRQTTSVPRQRRAASVEIPHADTIKRTRNTRKKGILKETIVEEGVTEMEVQEDPKLSNVKKTTKRKDTSVDSGAQEMPEAASKPRKGGRRASAKQDASEQFSFSQPDKTNNPPSDQKAIQEVPNFVFSPPHTRSKTVAPDSRD